MAQEIATRAPDVSTRGMFISTPQRFPLGTPLRIRFRVGRSGTFVHVRGEVRYCLEGVGVGVEFSGLSNGSHAAIEKVYDEEANW